MRALTQYSCYAATTHLAVKTLMLSTFTVAYIMPECFAAAREQRCRDIARDSDTPAALIVSRCSLVMSVGWTTFGIFTGEVGGCAAGGEAPGWGRGGGGGGG